MKLLDKKVINTSVQNERKLQIDTGMLLANKVDKLRKELLELEKQRADFISSSQGEIISATKDLKLERETIKSEINESLKRLRELREPLDEEWKRLECEKEEVIDLKIDSETYFQSLIKERGEIQKEKESVDEMKEAAEQNDYRIRTLLHQVEEEKRESKQLLSETQSLKETKEAELFTKETALNEKEKMLNAKEIQSAKDRLQLNKEVRLLAIKKQRRQ